MPAAITHYLHGEKVLEELKSENFISEIDESAFFWGCQGPDFLFTHRFFPWMKGESLANLGHRIHKDDPNRILTSMIKFVGEDKKIISASYLLGFICHYSLDSTVHPYVNFLANELLESDSSQTKTTFHCEIESALDTIVLRSETGALPSEKNLGDYFANDEEVQRMIASLYKFVIKECLNEDASEDSLYQATGDAYSVFRHITDRTGLKKSLLSKFWKRSFSCHVRPIIEDDNVDYANLSEIIWIDQYKTARNDTFFDIFEKAKEKAVCIIHDFQKQNIEELTKSEPFG